jgi:hypothetical protein
MGAEDRASDHEGCPAFITFRPPGGAEPLIVPCGRDISHQMGGTTWGRRTHAGTMRGMARSPLGPETNVRALIVWTNLSDLGPEDISPFNHD